MDTKQDRKAAILAETLVSLWVETDGEAVAAAVRIAGESADDIADLFYAVLMQQPDASPFLNHALVHERLRPSLARWIRAMFSDGERATIDAILDQNYQVGLIHARINIPLTLVNAQAILFVSELLDTVLDNMHEAYLGDLLGNVRQQQSLKMFMSGQNLALEGERLKSSLFDWLRNTVVAIYTANGPAIPSIEASDFGLWLNHKAELTFGRVAELDAIRTRTRTIAAKLGDTAAMADAAGFVRALNDDVTQMAYLLGAVIDKALEIEGGRDPLTRLLTRRFMPTIFLREVNISLRHGKPFAVLLIDADHFKSINDTHGHQAGDGVLTAMAEVLHGNVRAGDFVFRYGGEEFLILLTEMDTASAAVKAERLRAIVEEYVFSLAGHPLRITASIGVALHDGHPDYEHTVRRADAALYEAKRQGRNRVVISE